MTYIIASSTSRTTALAAAFPTHSNEVEGLGLGEEDEDLERRMSIWRGGRRRPRMRGGRLRRRERVRVGITRAIEAK